MHRVKEGVEAGIVRCVEGITLGIGTRFVAPMFVSPEPTFRKLAQPRFQNIPALLRQFPRIGIRRTFDGIVVNDLVATIGEGTAFDGNDDRAGSLRNRDVRGRGADHEPAECFNRDASFLRMDVEINQNAHFPAGFNMLEHLEHGAFLGNDLIAGAGAQVVKNRPEERVPEFLGDHQNALHVVRCHQGQPFEIAKMHAAVNRRFGGIGAVGVAVEAFNDDVFFHERLIHIRRPEKLEHCPRKGTVGFAGDA